MRIKNYSYHQDTDTLTYFYHIFLHVGEFYLSRWGGFPHMLGNFFSHRTHRLNRTFLRTISNSQNASGIQISQNVIAKGGCKVL